MKKLNKILTASAAASYFIMGSAMAADPTAVNVTLFKTEICNDTACMTILDDTTGVAAELVSGNGAFGDAPAVDVGSYNRFRFTLKNEILVSGDPGAPCSAITSQSTLIDNSSSATAADQVTIVFATGDAAVPGTTGWYANGTADHPFFMSAPVVVEANGTTDVTVQFNTADTLSCGSDSLAEIDAPTFAVSSYVQPPVADNTFTGGDYWLVGTSMHSPWLSAASDYTVGQFLSGAWPATAITAGEMIPPELVGTTPVYQELLNSADGPAYQAQIRSRTTREMRWGMKVRLEAPDATGAGNISFIRDPGHQRFAATFDSGNESFMQAPGVDGTPTVEGSYHIDASNRLTILPTGGIPIIGAISDDYETLVVADTSDGISLTLGVKVATGSSTIPANTYSWNQYMLEIGRDDSVFSGANGTGEDGDERLNAYYNGSIGWLDATDINNATMNIVGARLHIQNPDLTSASSFAETSDEAMTGDFSAFLSGFADGAGMVGPQLDSWMAISPSGQVGIMTGAAEYDYRFSDLSVGDAGRTEFEADQYRKNFSFNIMVQLADTGTHTMSSLAGTYFIGGLWDRVNTSGDASFGGDAGEVTLNADGTGSVLISNIDNLNRVNTDASTIGWDILNACIGVTGTDPSYTRLDIAEPNCVASGGRIIDAIVVFDPATPAEHMAAIFPSADGKAMTFFDPGSLDTAGVEGRSLGLGVKLK
ncbi:MAG: hypothetical protein OEY11_06065 [Gammaproteobacteria bacterium]|nr:hypothetical protein [Gammaproteobacteria bacterium]